MNDVIVDSSVLIEPLRGSSLGGAFLADIRATHRPVVHPVVEAELIAGARNRSELRDAKGVLRRYKSVAIAPEDAPFSLRLLERHRLSDGVSWEDCLLAATALRLEVPLATWNEKHFRVFRGLRVIKPY